MANSYIVSTEPNYIGCYGDECDDSGDINGVITALVTLLVIAVIGLVISIVINVFFVVQCKQSRCVVTIMHSM